MSLTSSDFQQAVLEDFKWAYEKLQVGTLKDFQGQHVAIMDKQILASGVNAITLTDAVCAEHHLDPDRVVVFYVDPPR